MKLKLVAGIMLLAAGFATAQEANPKITMNLGVSSAENALKEIARASGRNIEASPTLRKDYVVIDVVDAPVDDLLKRLSDLLNAEWVPVEDRLILSRPSVRSREDEKSDIEALTASWTNSIAMYLKRTETTPTGGGSNGVITESEVRTTGGFQFSFGNTSQGPAGKQFIRALLSQIDRRKLAEMQHPSRVVWSTSATRMQVPLTNRVLASAQKFVDDYRKELQANPTRSDGPMAGFGTPSAPGYDAKATTVLLTANTSGFGGNNVTFNAAVYDQQGKFIVNSTESINLIHPDSEVKVDAKNAKKLKLNPELKIFQDGLFGGSGINMFRVAFAGGPDAMSPMMSRNPGPRTPLKPETMEKLRNPVKNEPLNWLLGDILHQAADAHGLQLVAVIPDRLNSVVNTLFALSEPTTVTLFELLSRENLTMEVKDGWWTMKSRVAHRDRETRFIRKDLLELFNQFKAQGTLSIDQRYAYVREQEVLGGLTDLDSRIANAAFPGMDNHFQGIWMEDQFGLRIFGSFSSAQRQVLASNKAISVSALSTSARKWAENMIFSQAMGPTPNSAAQNQSGPGNMIRGFMGQQDLAEERTVSLANGLPSTGKIWARMNESYSYLAQGNDGIRLMEAQELIGMEAIRMFAANGEATGRRAEMLASLPVSSTPLEQMSFKAMKQTNVVIDVQPIPTLSRFGSVSEVGLPINQNFVKFDQLPPETTQQVRDTLRRMNQMGERGRRRGNN